MTKKTGMTVEIRPTQPQDLPWVTRFLRDENHSLRVVSRGQLHYPAQLPGFIGILDGKPAALLTFHLEQDELEVITLHAAVKRRGLGTALLAIALEEARSAGCRRLWLITTNDNRPAIDFYQNRGMELVAVHHDALEHSRQLKPEIPLIGLDRIPIRDEVEFEYPIINNK